MLGDRLVAIYETGSPNTLDAVIESEDWSDMAARTEYLQEIQSYDDAVVDSVAVALSTSNDRPTATRAPFGHGPFNRLPALT